MIAETNWTCILLGEGCCARWNNIAIMKYMIISDPKKTRMILKQILGKNLIDNGHLDALMFLLASTQAFIMITQSSNISKCDRKSS
jgi:hypothetical protein